MVNVTEAAAAGKVIAAGEDHIIFQPANSNYEWRLLTDNPYQGPLNQRIEGVIRVRARKVYTVPSGGNFVQPIFGPPRVIQGRLKQADEEGLLVHAGAPILVQWPVDGDAVDLSDGPLAIGRLVNVMALPGARFEPVGVSARSAAAQA